MRSSTLILAALVLAGCNPAESRGTDTGNGLVEVRLGLTSSESSEDYAAIDASGTRFSVTEALGNVSRIDFHDPGNVDCSNLPLDGRVKCTGGFIRINGPFMVDLVARTSTPTIDVQIPAGTYKRVDVRFESSAELSGSALAGSGVYDDAGTARPFDFDLSFNADARYESADGVEIREDVAQDVLLLLDVATWLSAAPITACRASGDLDETDGRLKIGDGRGQCRALENDIVNALKKSGRL